MVRFSLSRLRLSPSSPLPRKGSGLWLRVPGHPELCGLHAASKTRAHPCALKPLDQKRGAVKQLRRAGCFRGLRAKRAHPRENPYGKTGLPRELYAPINTVPVPLRVRARAPERAASGAGRAQEPPGRRLPWRARGQSRPSGLACQVARPSPPPRLRWSLHPTTHPV